MAQARGVLICDDGVSRCPWADGPPEYRRYHDEEWGRPIGEDDRVYEKLCLEGFQGGLSWLTILRKREAFRRAFAGFDPAAVAGFGDEDVDRLLADASIVRNRAKITATIANARATLQLRAEGVSLAAMFWRYESPPAEAPKLLADVPAETAASKALSRELRRRGFSFVGPTTAYAAMQSLGVVNDHLELCEIRPLVASERARFTLPS
jgi:DNA-3-methyladenine glycosylase I